jgi:hypothetical protein
MSAAGSVRRLSASRRASLQDGTHRRTAPTRCRWVRRTHFGRTGTLCTNASRVNIVTHSTPQRRNGKRRRLDRSACDRTVTPPDRVRPDQARRAGGGTDDPTAVALTAAPRGVSSHSPRRSRTTGRGALLWGVRG